MDLGNGQIYNDDCFNVFPEIADKSVDLVLCDLPYGCLHKEYVKSIISDIQDSLKKESKVPDYALIDEIKHTITEDLMNTLRIMYKDGELEYHRTLNTYGLSLKGDGDE